MRNFTFILVCYLLYTLGCFQEGKEYVLSIKPVRQAHVNKYLAPYPVVYPGPPDGGNYKENTNTTNIQWRVREGRARIPIIVEPAIPNRTPDHCISELGNPQWHIREYLLNRQVNSFTPLNELSMITMKKIGGKDDDEMSETS